MHTRSTKTSNKHWTQLEERTMVRLRRYENLTFEEIAKKLNRPEDAVEFRFQKLLNEHATGDIPEREVLQWFNLNVE